MNPQNPYQQVLTPEAVIASNKRKLKWALICLIGPTALIVVTLILYALVNFLTGASTPPPETSAESGNLFAQQETPVARPIMNILLFIVGAFTVLTWLPGIIAGIILLANRKPVPPHQ